MEIYSRKVSREILGDTKISRSAQRSSGEFWRVSNSENIYVVSNYS